MKIIMELYAIGVSCQEKKVCRFWPTRCGSPANLGMIPRGHEQMLPGGFAVYEALLSEQASGIRSVLLPARSHSFHELRASRNSLIGYVLPIVPIYLPLSQQHGVARIGI